MGGGVPTRAHSCTPECAGCAPVVRRRSTLPPSPDGRRDAAPLSTAELAISHCAQRLHWLPRVTHAVRDSQLQLKRVTVYLKCGDGAFSFPRSERTSLRGLLRTINLPNVGRCDHSWAHHLARFHESLADVILFVKDSTFNNPNPQLARLTLSPRTVIRDVLRSGSGCFRRPSVDGLDGRLHLREKLFAMRKRTYRGATKKCARAARTRARCSLDAGTARAASWVRYQNWRQGGAGANFQSAWNMTSFAKRAYDQWFYAQLLNQTFIPVCYGGASLHARLHHSLRGRTRARRFRAQLARAQAALHFWAGMRGGTRARASTACDACCRAQTTLRKATFKSDFGTSCFSPSPCSRLRQAWRLRKEPSTHARLGISGWCARAAANASQMAACRIGNALCVRPTGRTSMGGS